MFIIASMFGMYTYILINNKTDTINYKLAISFKNDVERHIQINENMNKRFGNAYYKSDEEKLIDHIGERVGCKLKDVREITCNISFYSSLPCENGIYELTASGTELNYKTVANNILPFGTELYIEGYGTKRVEDRGSNKYFKSESDFDIYVPRLEGESDGDYYRRVNNLGRKVVKGYIIEKE